MKRLVLLAALFLVALLLPTTVAQAGAGSPHQITVEKVLVGGGDPNQEFEIAIVCVETEGGDTRDELAFVTANEPDSIGLGNEAQTCTLSEPDAQGAVASFACSDPTGDAVCVSDNVVEFTGDGVPDGQGDVLFTVTNTFGSTPSSESTITTDPATSTTSGAAGEATTRPSFTG